VAEKKGEPRKTAAAVIMWDYYGYLRRLSENARFFSEKWFATQTSSNTLLGRRERSTGRKEFKKISKKRLKRE